MKVYLKPSMKKLDFLTQETLSSLSSWLEDNHLTDAGITTYVINS